MFVAFVDCIFLCHELAGCPTLRLASTSLTLPTVANRWQLVLNLSNPQIEPDPTHLRKARLSLDHPAAVKLFNIELLPRFNFFYVVVHISDLIFSLQRLTQIRLLLGFFRFTIRYLCNL